jgi:hypothetical protein
MRFMALIYTDEKTDISFGTPEWDQLMTEYRAFGEEARRRDAIIAGDPLQSTETATTLRLSEGKVVTLDGPFVETKEQLGGYYILECADQAEAAELAAMIPSAKAGCVEVRALAGHDTRVIDPPKQTRYMLMICGDQSNWLPDDDPRVVAGVEGHQRLTNWLIERGEFVAGDALARASTATTVRVRDGQVLHSDGPYAETKEQLGGFYILNVRDLDYMLELARKFPLGPDSSYEIRPLQEV